MVDPDLYVEEHPSERVDAPLVVFVHGMLDSTASYAPVVEDLLRDFSVVTYDRRGWGRSRAVAPAQTFDDHVTDLVAVMDGRRATLVGHSYGGSIALVTAARHPELVTALGVFEPALAWTDRWPTRAVVDEQRLEYEREHFGVGLDGRRPRTRAEKLHDAAVVEHEIVLGERVDLALTEITVPTLVARGALSAPWRADVTEWFAGELGAAVLVVEESGHTVHRMRPLAFAEFVRQTAVLADDPALP